MTTTPHTTRIALVGPMGIGKTTAIRALCEGLAIDCDVPNLDTKQHEKATTTVGTDFGEVDLGNGDRLQIYGCPGQERFSFVRHWVLSSSIGVFVMIDLDSPSAVQEATRLLKDVEQSSTVAMAMILLARPTHNEAINAFSIALADQGIGPTPMVRVDVRDRRQLLEALQIMTSMLGAKE